MPRVSVIIPTLIVLCLYSFVARVEPVIAQGHDDRWTLPSLISFSDVFRSSPRLVASDDGHLHAFWVENTSLDTQRAGAEAIYYAEWDGKGWSVPIDIVVAPGRGIISSIAVILYGDREFRLFFIDAGSGRIFSSAASRYDARRPQAWTTPQPVADRRAQSMAAVCHEDKWFLAYTTMEAPFDVHFQRSSDFDSWSEPVLVSEAPPSEEAAADVSFAVGDNGEIYVAWTQNALPSGYPPQRTMFSRSTDGGATWSMPLEMQEGAYGFPLLFAGPGGQLFLAYNGTAAIGGRYFRYSTDSGITWSERITISPGIGGLTGNAMALDSAGTLHYASAADSPSGVVYTRWSSGQWSPIVNIASITPGSDESVRQGYEPAMTVVQGNQLHVVYIGANHDGIFHTMTTTSAPAIALVFRPTPLGVLTPQPTATLSLEVEPAATSETKRPGFLFVDTERPHAFTGSALFISTSSVLLLIGITLVVARRRRR